MVPEGWKKGTLKDSLEEIHQGLNTAAEKLKYSDEGWPILQTKHIVSGVIDASGARKVSDPDFELYRGKYQPRKNSILFSNIGTIGKSCLVKEDFEGLVAWNILYIKPKSDACVEFLVYYLQRHDEKGYFSSLVAGNAAKFINKTSMEGLQILYPPLPEQKKIARILSTWDQAITATERLLENSQQRKKGLMQQLLTGKKRLPGFEGEWRTVELGSLGSTYSGLSGKTKEDFGAGEPFVTYMSVFSDGAIKTDRFDYVRLSEGESQNKVQYGDILFTTSSETPEEVGMASVLLEDLPYNLYLNSFCFGFRPNSFEALVPEYAKFLFRGEEMRRRISALAQGATRYNLSKRQLVKLDVLLPGKAEQAAISQILTTSDMEISAVRHRLVYLREEKKALMQQLLTGKRRVSVETEAA